MISIKIFEEKKVRSQYDAEKEGNETVTNCNQLKLQSEDGKFYKTDVGSVEDIYHPKKET
jgi:hypothetical protein